MIIERVDQIENKTDRELIELLQQLVRIPSWVPDNEEGKKTQNEVKLVEFLESWLKTHTDVKVARQALDYGRFNLIATKGNPETIFLAHIDTVAPPANSQFPPFDAVISDGKVWGRGSSDMKCGIAAILQAIALCPKANNFWVMFYADEEYDFLGMKAIVREMSKLKTKCIISADGCDLKIGYGCRGLIEIRVRVLGKSSHATSKKGRNAIQGVYTSVLNLSKYFEELEKEGKGRSSLNLAYVLGGKSMGKESFDTSNKLVVVGQEGNVVPDIAEFVIDVRPASPEITVDKIVDVLSESLEKMELKIDDVKVRHDLGAWITDREEIVEYCDIAKTVTGNEPKFSDSSKGGYLDIQMLWKALGEPPCLVFGGGTGSKEHTDDENVEIANVIMARNFFIKVLDK